MSGDTELLLDKLNELGVKANVKVTSMGPSATVYAVTPGPGVRYRDIIGTDQDLRMALGAQHITMYPGNGHVVLEVPNKEQRFVQFDEMPDIDEFGTIPELPIVVGMTKDGWLAINVEELPHLLIAGTTGSGKSVMVHTIVCQLLINNTPEDVGLVLMDFKRVELNAYAGVDHLALPIITELNGAKLALHWLVAEMERRFRLMERAGVQHILAIEELEFPPHLVVVIDELADLMLQDRSVEPMLVRLAQKGRAAGVHLVLSTQRPTTDVVTGLIKANVPSRMAFAVASQIDSRVILDEPGAEHLVGKGDLLFKRVGQPVVHGQGAFIDHETVVTIAGDSRSIDT